MPGSSLWLLPPASHPLREILATLISRTLPATFPRESSADDPSVGPHFFAPHVTLTSEIPPSRYGDDPQGWLDAVPFPLPSPSPSFSSSSSSSSSSGLAKGGGNGGGGAVSALGKVTREEEEEEEEGKVKRGKRARVRFETVASQDVFFRRCFVRVGFDGVRDLAGVARAVGVLGEEVAGGVGDGGDGGDAEIKFEFGEETERWLESWRAEYGPHLSLMYGDVPISDETLEKVSKMVQQAGVRLEEKRTGAGGQGGWDGWDGGVIWLVPTDKSIAEWKPIATREV